MLGRESGECKNFVRKCWCDFGGKMEEGESEEDTAAREFFEESLGLVCTDQCLEGDGSEIHSEGGETTALHGYDTVDRLAQALRENRFAFRVRMCLNHGANPDVPRRFNVTYVKQIPWNPQLPIDFAIMKDRLGRLHEISSRTNELARSFIRDRDTCTHPIPGCRMNIGDLSVMSDASEDDDDFSTIYVLGLSDIEYDRERDQCVTTVEYHRSDSDHMGRRVVRAVGEYCCFLRALRELKEYYDSLPRSIRYHPCVYVAENGIVSVRPEFLEKDCLQYWSQERLREVLENGGHYKKEYFRSTFIPTIAVVLKVFQNESHRVKGYATDASCRYTIYCRPKCDMPMEIVEDLERESTH